MYIVGCPFDKSAQLFVDLPDMKATCSVIQADHSCTPQISFPESSDSQSIMPGSIHLRSIPLKGIEGAELYMKLFIKKP